MREVSNWKTINLKKDEYIMTTDVKAFTVDEMIEKARKAMLEIKYYNQEQTDHMVKVIGKVVYDNARELAEEAAEETQFGNADAKETKNKFFSSSLWYHLRGEKSVGEIERDVEPGIIKIAHPAGVIGSIAPVTVPNILPMGNSMLALKGRNAIIISPHPRSTKSVHHTVELMREELAKIGAPKDLIQVVPVPSKEASAKVMKKVDVVIATGGPGLVKAAYSSGKPAFGVGAGNAPLILEDTDDLDAFAQETVFAREYDNGTACVCTQTLLYPKKDEADVREAMERAGTYWIEDEATVEKIRKALFDGEGNFAKELAGKSPQDVAEKAGIEIPADTKIIATKTTKYGFDEALSTEKIAPVLSVIPYETFDEALEISNANLDVAGKGHTAGVYSSNEDHIIKAGIELPVSRVMINQPTSDAGSGPRNSIIPTNTLGCGTWSNNSISENLSYKHLLNIQRIALPIEKEQMPEYVWDLD